MNGTVLPDLKPIPQRVLKFLGDWLGSTATLFIDPTNALRVYKSEPQIISCIKRDIAFSASCLFVSNLIFLIVLLRTGSEAPLALYASDLTSDSVLTLIFWMLYAIVIGSVIKAMGGLVDYRINVSFCVRVLATFYLVAEAISTIVFMSSGDLKLIAYGISTIILRIVLPVMFMPVVLWKQNGLFGQKRLGLYLVITALAAVNAALDYAMFSPTMVARLLSGGIR
jgi:hypothetical protein